MRRKIRIAPSLLTISNLDELEIKVRELDNAGADMFHIDVMDGIFVSATTPYLNPEITRRIAQATEQDLDVHLMVQNPAEHIDKFIDAGAKIVTIHAESDGDISGLLQKIRRRGIRAGLAINPSTDLDKKVVQYCRDADMILFMTVVPGKAGQAYIEEVNPKIEQARRLFPTMNIQVDGGIKADNAYMAITAGANILVSGTGIFSQPDYKVVMDKMREAILIGSDHAGYNLKEDIKRMLASQKTACIDVGTYNEESCDYPVYGKRVATGIQHGFAKKGILICGTGIGMSMVANRYQGVRAARVVTEYDAQMAKQHNDANILCIGARSIGTEVAYALIQTWITTRFEQRHQRRLDML